MSEDTIYLPDTIRLPLDADRIMSRKPGDLLDYLQRLILDLENTYARIAMSFNRFPEYVAQDAQPTPADGQLLLWKDTNAGVGQPVAFLVYNNAGTVYTFASVEVA